MRRVGEDKANYIKRVNLIRLMDERGLDHDKLAELYKLKGENTSYIYQLTGGIHPIGPRTLKKLARIFQVDPDEFHKSIPGDEETLYTVLKDDLKKLDKAFRSRSDADKEEIIAHLKRQIALLSRVK